MEEVAMRTKKNNPVVLIVDDTSTMRRSLSIMLRDQALDIHFADSAERMFEMLPQINPDTILLDALMPGMNGFEACRVCKAAEEWKHIPILIVTSLSGPESLKQSLDAGADDYICKPVNILELKARVSSALRIKAQFDELQSLVRIREQMTSILVHDMRTPLASIMMSADIGKHFATDERLTRAFNTVRTQSETLDGLVNDMLTAASLENGELALDLKSNNASIMVESALERIRQLASRYQLNLALDCGVDEAEVKVDSKLLARVLDNLLSNAMKYAPAESTITVRLRNEIINDVRNVSIEILDEGPGVPKEERDLIFDKFQIGSAKTERGNSFGLGLPFCKLVVEAHGGTLDIDDNTPVGAIFRTTLPA